MAGTRVAALAPGWLPFLAAELADGSLDGRAVGVLGCSFKPDSDGTLTRYSERNASGSPRCASATAGPSRAVLAVTWARFPGTVKTRKRG